MLHAIVPKTPKVFITEELDRRVPVKIDSLKEKIALQELAALMASNPEQVLPKFVSLAMEMAGGVSAGLSLYEDKPLHRASFAGTTCRGHWRNSPARQRLGITARAVSFSI